MTYEDITSIDTRPLRGQQLVVSAETPSRPYVVPSPPPSGGRDWSEELFHQRDTAIAEAEVLRLELKDLAEQRDALTLRLAEVAVLNGQMAQENARLRERLQQIVELHTDSPAGVCPSCGRIGEQSDTDDGLVNWPCPTVQIANPRAA
ncbi:MAG TPA: hypothetical protein VF174_09030 [Micromonosporaceae bacterium]